MTFKLTLITWLFLLLVGRGANAQEADEPGVAIHPWQPAKRVLIAPTPHQATDPEVVEVVDITPFAAGPAPVVRVAPKTRPRRGPFFTLDAGAGYGGYATLFGEAVSGPIIAGSIAMTFGGGRTRHGLRLGAYYGFMNGDYNELFEGDSGPIDSRLYGVNLAYVLQVGGFWLSAGWGAMHIASRLDEDHHDPYYNDFSDEVHASTVPEGILALGYDIRFSEHVGLRLGGEIGTFFVSWRGQLGGSLVLRF